MDEESFIEEMTNFTQMEPPKESQSTYLEQRKFLDLANMQDDELMTPVLSKGKPTFQSSIFSPTASPERAVDGSLLDDFERGTCIQTQEEINPWWMVDLGCTQTVKSVAITPRQDCCTEELHGALILVGDSPDTGGIFNARCAVINSLSQGKTEFFKCETMQGRYVSVVNPKRRTFLSFCEVRVFGKASDSISSSIATSSPESQPFLPKAYDQESRELPGPELSKQRPTSQSSVFIPSQFPEKPMDGSIQSGHCVQTLQETDPWWMVDLGSTQTIGSVSITNRKDCCQEQIKGTMILVGDSPYQGGKFNARCASIPFLDLGIKHVVSCEGMKGRYVTIIHPGREKVLSFCDVKVFGKIWNSDKVFPDELELSSHDSSYSLYNFDLMENNFGPVLSKGKPAFQSSISNPLGSPERAVDGSLLADFEKGTCIQTQREVNPWWMVDLGCTQTVKSVAITPRKDCCTEELRGALILVGDSPDGGGTLNARCAVIGFLDREKTETFRCGLIHGRYVSVLNPGKEKMISLCEVRVFGKASKFPPLDNLPISPKSLPSSPGTDNAMDSAVPVVSRGKPAFQSSVYSALGSPERAVDGSLLSDFNKGSCIQTYPENDPWWMVDLGSPYTVDSVSITSRRDCCSDLMNGAMILIGDSQYMNGRMNPRCAMVPAMRPGKTESFSCGSMKGRYVTITIPGRGKLLTMCEVQVFGKAFEGPEKLQAGDSGTQISNLVQISLRRKRVSQSSIFDPSGSPERAVDGSLESDFWRGSCIQTHQETGPWWMIDLESTQPVATVAITNRRDCCHEQINGAEILVGDSFDKGGKSNPRCARIFALGPGKTESFNCGSLRGRYVTITIPGRGKLLTFCEVQILSEMTQSLPGSHPSHHNLPPTSNKDISMPFVSTTPTPDGIKNYIRPCAPLLSQGMNVFQSSTSSLLGSPERAIDGCLAGNFSKGSCIQTLSEYEPWWMVDLDSSYLVDYVAITNRKDCCHEQLNGAVILVGDSGISGGKFNPRCATISSLDAGKTETFFCGSMNGRYVTVSIPGKNTFLTFCEVQVFGKLAPSLPHVLPKSPTDIHKPIGVNIALGKFTYQSSTFHSTGLSGKAVDGNEDSDFYKNSCTHTNKDFEPWWMVDLTSKFIVDNVTVIPRGDRCVGTMAKYEITIGDSKENGGKSNPRCGDKVNISPGEKHIFKCYGMQGRFITVTMPKVKEFLSLCEVEVFGEQLINSVPSLNHISLSQFLPI
ncbi:uncharacterized protein LOC103103854 isoform X3 [Monodelphis domestica]|uniref:uncharacterized protein LOC103103854 isoform X3 n=1 Tax=Monodelphis domestica TaxID=13616 RepID=UPI0024E1BD4C|nr:uncharacterized protein LOC103103854 isoform X3 [Monodelphis domestica]